MPLYRKPRVSRRGETNRPRIRPADATLKPQGGPQELGKGFSRKQRSVRFQLGVEVLDDLLQAFVPGKQRDFFVFKRAPAVEKHCGDPVLKILGARSIPFEIQLSLDQFDGHLAAELGGLSLGRVEPVERKLDGLVVDLLENRARGIFQPGVFARHSDRKREKPFGQQIVAYRNKFVFQTFDLVFDEISVFSFFLLVHLLGQNAVFGQSSSQFLFPVVEHGDHDGGLFETTSAEAFLQLFPQPIQFFLQHGIRPEIVIDQLSFRTVRHRGVFPVLRGKPQVVVDAFCIGKKGLEPPFRSPNVLLRRKLRVQIFEKGQVRQSSDVFHEQSADSIRRNLFGGERCCKRSPIRRKNKIANGWKGQQPWTTTRMKSPGSFHAASILDPPVFPRI